MAKGLGHQGPHGGVIGALALVDVSEDFLPFLRLDAMLKNASCVAANQLTVDNGVGGGSALDLSGLCLTSRELVVHEVGEDGLGPSRGRDGI